MRMNQLSCRPAVAEPRQRVMAPAGGRGGRPAYGCVSVCVYAECILYITKIMVTVRSYSVTTQNMLCTCENTRCVQRHTLRRVTPYVLRPSMGAWVARITERYSASKTSCWAARGFDLQRYYNGSIGVWSCRWCGCRIAVGMKWRSDCRWLPTNVWNNGVGYIPMWPTSQCELLITKI